MSLLAASFFILVLPARGSGPASAAASASEGPEGTLGVAVILPLGASDVQLVAHEIGADGQATDPVLFTDDGSFEFDLRNDGEYWALLNPLPGKNRVIISGQIDGVDVHAEEEVSIPAAWMSKTYPVTLIAVPSEGGYRFERVLSGRLPTDDDAPTGTGLAGEGEQVGLSPTVLYLGWGLLVLVAGATAAVRSAVERVRAELQRLAGEGDRRAPSAFSGGP